MVFGLPMADDTYEVVFWCRDEACFCDLRHAIEVDEHHFYTLMRYYRAQMHDPVVRFVGVDDEDDLPDWDLDNLERVNDD